MRERCIEDFIGLGFTRLEAEVYIHLVQNPPQTGYKVAKALGRPNSNTYRAIATLEAKGALLVTEGETRMIRAVPVDELLDQITARFHRRREMASRHLATLRERIFDDRIYMLGTADQVWSRCRRMLERCREMAFLDLFPAGVSMLGEELAALAAAGKRVAVQVYEPAVIQGAEVVVHPRGAEILQAWPLQAVILMIDGTQSLLGLLDRDGRKVHFCAWTRSICLSYVLLGYANSEMILSRMTAALRRGATAGELRSLQEDWRNSFPVRRAPAHALLWEQFETPDRKE